MHNNITAQQHLTPTEGLNWQEPLLSVKCLVYNHEKYLRECFEGFIMQKTTFPFEVIVHDDASTDNSKTIIEEYAEKYPHIFKPIYELENQFSKGALNQAIHPHIKGKYIALCEGDDYWIDENKLQKQVEYLENHSECALVYTDFNLLIDNKGEIKKSIFENNLWNRPKDFRELLLTAGYIAPMSWVARWDLFQSYAKNDCIDGSFVYGLEFSVRNQVYYLPETTCVYRVVTESASHSKNLNKTFNYKSDVFHTQEIYFQKYPKYFSEQDYKALQEFKLYNFSLLKLLAIDKRDLAKQSVKKMQEISCKSKKVRLHILLYKVLPYNVLRFFARQYYSLQGYKTK